MRLSQSTVAVSVKREDGKLEILPLLMSIMTSRRSAELMRCTKEQKRDSFTHCIYCVQVVHSCTFHYTVNVTYSSSLECIRKE